MTPPASRFGAAIRAPAGVADAAAREIPGNGAKKTPLRVLVVDDEWLIRWSVAQTLADLGMHVDQASDAASALKVLASDGPVADVVVLDLRLPDMDDLTLLAAIRREWPDIAVVLMTAFGTPEIVNGAYELGVVNILSKPFELGELGRVVLAAGGAAAS